MKNIKDKILLISILLNIVFLFIVLNSNENKYLNNVNENSKEIVEKQKIKTISNQELNDVGIKKNTNKLNGFFDVERVVDGDTVILNMNGKSQRVRLVGINTPESMAVNGRVVECFGKEAKVEAERILEGQKVFFEVQENDYYDKNGRMLGFVFLKSENGKYDKNFSEIMIKNGFGYEYTYKGRWYKYQKEYKNAEKYAKDNKKGLWGSDGCR